ncbi:hypothetical protein JQ557_00905 [Bradyrhizobium sp. U87765 SZCCT0131]|uniref:hypothetical protein n=1 Tax=unclassified Bradyrhizobium TaxID=2631580 RepID=UPI001BA8D082|nr:MULTISPECIES: hypothetical protein [unclassified Bradyrhizobium]MBR1216531.1 hypothetical protein [Bradyrhizobium sp. U87765 SZCCT0131]MBR1259713.1 hypothetical protein [Bradyrhizobium sp. U87765 SZCCT0134]MBR1305854.1 hypothetical protein [Bradyrhizobium sp. U87765 SZCCT0110]MBR1322221.1 hypothetical protein [Bradyrhizobium sp. U87765 SZCCT0109]MBR1350500.1 hypothetical protein [Bradyrhizobium sp. U87765 SZCCT0048]
MHVNYLETFLAFLGLTIGGISVLPGLFFSKPVGTNRGTGPGCALPHGTRRACEQRRPISR